ncbi:TetR/AcrR family transcriptional regulator [Phycicoccus ginsengisoli]
MEQTGAGRPDRTLTLLWRDRSPADSGPSGRRRGPRRARTVDDVVDAALSLADAEGLAAVTMRALATRLGTSPMTLYTYVPGRPELLDLMADSLYLAMPREPWRRGSSWRDRLTRVAEDNRSLLAAHPWLAEIASLSRPPLGPGQLAKYEHELAAFDDSGLDDVTVDAALTYLLGFVVAHGRAAHDAERAVRDSTQTDEQWWAANQPLLATVLDPDAYPRAVRVGAAAGAAQAGAWSAEHAWRFGLACTLDGLAGLIEPRRTGEGNPQTS